MTTLSLLFTLLMVGWFLAGPVWRGYTLWRDRRILQPDSPFNLRPYAKSLVIYTAFLLIGLKVFSS